MFRDHISVPTIPALALGADGVAGADAAIQAIGCIGARIRRTNNCPAGIATQNPELRRKLDVDHAAERLARLLHATVQLMREMAKACGHHHLNQFRRDDLASWHRELAEMAGIESSGWNPRR